MRTTNHLLAATAGVAALALSACGVSNTTGGSGDGEEYPAGGVEMYVGASAGGSSDLISRAVSKGLSDELGASFPVINQEGANGALAANKVAKAKADGKTIAIQNASLFAITPLAVSEDEVTDLADFDVVQGVSRDDYVMVTGPKSGFKSLDDIKAATKKVTYATTGVGTGAQLSCGLTYASADIDAEAVPFDGGAPALTAVLGNQVDTACIQVGEAIENIESGKLTPLSVFGPERVEYLPEVPTAKEQGLDVEVSQYRFMTVPKGTPDNVKDTIAEAMQATFKTEEYQAFNKQNSLTPMEISGDEVVAQLDEDKKRFADLVEQYGLDLGQG
ncbi:tripartite tricarboxylate transporter substrate binding protein [Nocardioides sp.]|uniref:Bug family tripartite tricarboxylate transporter substrate binding protein n=1 Tax=Nocardioides sp. TaxID=35761 RepID=UPI0019884997|nr:tripartite tricarboxylate transporter substrate binding protein [Nocardioides sp.]MBC7279081.1 tripartite tricarboxylate transporter substrate binding protein [Nocardioides sp.]